MCIRDSYCDGENGRRVRRTRTYPTMEQAEQVIAEYRRAQLFGGMSAPRDVFCLLYTSCSAFSSSSTGM